MFMGTQSHKVMLAAVVGWCVAFGGTLVHDAHAKRVKREYTRLRRADFDSRADFKAYRDLLRVKGMRGIPDDCELGYMLDDDLIGVPAFHCRPIRIRGTSQ